MGTIFVDNIKDNVGGKEVNIGDGSLNVASDGSVGVRTTSPSDNLEITPSADEKGLTLKTTANIRPYLNFDANRSSAGNNLAHINFKWNGTDVARIIGVAGSDTTNKDDGLITFQTASAGSTNERMRIDSSGNVLIAKTATGVGNFGHQFESTGTAVFSRDGDLQLVLNRGSNDGVLASLRQAESQEGTIEVSGSTVSYNGFSGLHESSGIATDTPVGTVVSTIDELDVYHAKQHGLNGEEDNPKAGQTRADHAKVKISDSVGDKRIYGVVTKFNEQDKVNVASVGIGSVRVTGACEGGDLLESNGDGTAKVQSDDIVRSKTLGKVTIGNSNTGVKLVSCVLYCG